MEPEPLEYQEVSPQDLPLHPADRLEHIINEMEGH